MADEKLTPHTSPFDTIRYVDDADNEYWSARDLQKLLGYVEWRKFADAIERATVACKNSGYESDDHFVQTAKMIKTGKGAKRELKDYHLSRYACYLIVQNADSEKPIVALGQTYFAVQTRRQELADQLAALPEDQKRLILRSEMAVFNQQLAEADLGLPDADELFARAQIGFFVFKILADKKLKQREIARVLGLNLSIPS